MTKYISCILFLLCHNQLGITPKKLDLGHETHFKIQDENSIEGFSVGKIVRGFYFISQL